MRRLTTLTLLSLLVVATCPLSAAAQPEALFEQAQTHLRRARVHAENGDHLANAIELQQAEERLAEALKVQPAGPTADAWKASLAQTLSLESMAFESATLLVEAFDSIKRLERLRGTLSVVEQDQLDRLDARIGTLALPGLPEEARVRVDGRLLSQDELQRPIRLVAGQHSLEIRVADSVPIVASIQIEARRELRRDVKLDLIAKPGLVRFEASAEGANVSIDGKAALSVPTEVPLEPGDHTYSFGAETYEKEDGKMTVLTGERLIIRARLVPRKSPVGLRATAHALLLVNGRLDTPLNSGVSADRDFSLASPVVMGLSVQFFYTVARVLGIRLGAEVSLLKRELNALALGALIEWWPDALSFKWISLCPVSFSGLVVGLPPASVGRFSSGEKGFKLEVKAMIGDRSGEAFFDLGVFVRFEDYKRSLTSLNLISWGLQLGFGIDR